MIYLKGVLVLSIKGLSHWASMLTLASSFAWNFNIASMMMLTMIQRMSRGIAYPIALICMSTHKASAARCHIEHQAWFGQPAIRALPWSPLRMLALSVLFTSWSTSYQATWRVSERTSVKGTRQCKPTQSSFFTLRQSGYRTNSLHLHFVTIASIIFENANTDVDSKCE